MIGLTLLLFLAQAQQRSPEAIIAEIRESGRLAAIAEPSSERAASPRGVPPGAPPVLSFRYFEGRDRHRFGKLDLIVDDAGH